MLTLLLSLIPLAIPVFLVLRDGAKEDPRFAGAKLIYRS